MSDDLVQELHRLPGRRPALVELTTNPTVRLSNHTGNGVVHRKSGEWLVGVGLAEWVGGLIIKATPAAHQLWGILPPPPAARRRCEHCGALLRRGQP